MTVGAEACKWHQKLSFVPGVLSVVSAVAGTCVAGAYSHGIVCEIHGLLSPSLWRKPVNGLMHRADKDYNRCRVGLCHAWHWDGYDLFFLYLRPTTEKTRNAYH